MIYEYRAVCFWEEGTVLVYVALSYLAKRIGADLPYHRM